ncbi:hypothetical protein GGR95_000604 [Sulfitobacter undariae]|uniref:Uncharacterized protein n=1 Tax=Sulfitobacter undariae TaxID=1563671 RepID=A0A7W6E6L3_9RHOB|nr:hypothetical protein [Sulfitobacter undariae]MBB3992985.1 hypothetical protein [Sulfitobacter undariae]
MRSIGGLLAFLGIFAIVLSAVGRVPSYLFWIYNWGEAVAWGIKIGLIVVGGAMYLLGYDSDEQGDDE